MYELVFSPYHKVPSMTKPLDPHRHLTGLILWPMAWPIISDSDNRFIISADVMDGEVVPYGKKFSEWHSWAIRKIRKPVNR